MSKEFPNEATLIADLKATFPGLYVRPVREYGVQGYNHGVWTGGTGDSDGCMPDGLPIFNGLENGCDDEWEGHVHKGFSQWLSDRGWSIEAYDAEVYFILPAMQALRA